MSGGTLTISAANTGATLLFGSGGSTLGNQLIYDGFCGSGSKVDPKIGGVDRSDVSDKPSVLFVPAFASGSEGATVTAYKGYPGQYATLKNYDFSNIIQDTLWVKVVSQDGKTIIYYDIEVYEF